MDKPIAVRDLVVVVRPKSPLCLCGITEPLRYIFRVSSITNVAGRCSNCGRPCPTSECAWVDGKNEVYDIYRLKRIPPLEELEGERTEEDMREPA